MSGPAAPAVSARREEILAIAAELFAEKGFATTTVREIADTAGILSGSLYHHFDSKESMVDEILRGFLDEIVHRYRTAVGGSGDPAEILRELVRTAFGALGTNRAAVAVMLNEFGLLVQYPRFAYLRERADETEQLWAGVVDRGITSGAFRSDVDSRMIYRFMRDAIWVSVRWYRPEGAFSPEQIADFYLDVLLDGIAMRSGPARSTTTSATEPVLFKVEELPWPDETTTGAPHELVEEARRKGAKRKFLARGEGGFHSQYSTFPPGYTVPPHSHDHDEMMVVLAGSCTVLDDGPGLRAHDSIVLHAGHEYGFRTGDDGMTYLTIRTGASGTRLATQSRGRRVRNPDPGASSRGGGA
ncbi:MAG: TetR family transcriptional regulator [Acidimicrobiia bacterium]